jgi:hypothetical protein
VRLFHALFDEFIPQNYTPFRAGLLQTKAEELHLSHLFISAFTDLSQTP